MTNLSRISLALSAAALLAAKPAVAQTSPADAGRVWNAAEVTRQPQLINERAVSRRVARTYPRQLLDSGVHGRALLQLTVGADGRVEDVAGVSATRAQFATVASAWARAMRFAPAIVGGTPVRCRVLVPVDFALADG